MSYSKHISTACAHAQTLSSFDLWVIVGEWTPAQTDCGTLHLTISLDYTPNLLALIIAKYLNGRGAGSRYDGSHTGSTRVGSCTGLTGKASSFSSSFKTFLRMYWEAQVITFEKGQGWIQWTWKAENADEWVRVLFSTVFILDIDHWCVDIPRRPRWWMDPSGPYRLQLPQYMWLIFTTLYLQLVTIAFIIL